VHKRDKTPHSGKYPAAWQYSVAGMLRFNAFLSMFIAMLLTPCAAQA
jgi:hypothetical protein